MNKEYAEFLQSDVVQPPEDLSARVFQRITLLLNPLGRVVFAKILGLHAVVGFLLSIEELKVLRRNRWVQTSSLGMLSLAILFFAGAEVALSMGIYWWVGSWLGGLLSAEAMYKYRSFQPI